MIDLTEPERLDLKSLSIVEDQKSKLKGIFPHIFNEDKIDFDKLRQTLGEEVDEGQELYGMTWPGKSECFKIIQLPSTGTLKPCREESVNFDETENLFIEGDNLEALKILQKSYYGKIKMIYIDPPYNTGKEFIYPDKYSETLDTYLAYTGQINDEGIKFSTNTETDGRFHSKWLNMMYPRLFLARNLLREDGVIFISINEIEHDNLIKICNEIFGEENFIADICVVSNLKGRSDDKYIASAHEYLLFYKKDNFQTLGLPLPKEYLDEYKELDSEGTPIRLLGLRKRGTGAKREDRPSMFYTFFINPNSGSVSLERDENHPIPVIPKLSDGSDGRWRWGKETTISRIQELTARQISGTDRWDIFQIDKAYNEGELRRIKPKSIWDDKSFSNEAGTLTFKELMNSKSFDNPKPVELIRYCLQQSTEKDDTVLDFFAGSCTTAHAILKLNKEDNNSNRKFIMVQLPEQCDEESEAFKAGYKTIAEIGKERIRSVIKKIEYESKQSSSQTTLFNTDSKDNIKKLDIGFKVFKLDKSNFNLWDGSIEVDATGGKIIKQLQLAIENINPRSSEEDILYELLLKSGFPLTTKIEEIELAGKKVYSIENDALLICLSRDLSKEVITEMARRKPARVICLDDGFAGNDQLKTNAVQIMKSFGVEDFRTV